MSTDPRTALDQLARDHGEDYAGLSRLIGRNPAYVHQFIKRGVPRKLDEEDRRRLARYFGVSEQMLGGPVSSPLSTDRPNEAGHRLVPIPRLDVGASAGHGSIVDVEELRAMMGFDERQLRSLVRGPIDRLAIIRVDGESMAPTLSDGDSIMVDEADGAERLREGVYVLRRDDVLSVKRLAPSPATRSVAVKSDNPAYPSWPDCPLADLTIIGRVIWAGRKVG